MLPLLKAMKIFSGTMPMAISCKLVPAVAPLVASARKTASPITCRAPPWRFAPGWPTSPRNRPRPPASSNPVANRPARRPTYLRAEPLEKSLASPMTTAENRRGMTHICKSRR